MKILLLSLLLISCTKSESKPRLEFGEYQKPIEENSGMAYSKKTDRLYTIEDSSNPPKILITDIKGHTINYLPLKNAKNIDWEAISVGPCPIAGKFDCVYVGDIGDNEDDRKSVQIYIAPEDNFGHVDMLEFTYEGGPVNAESMAVHPITGKIYILSKNYDGKEHSFFELKGNVAKKISTVNLDGPAGDMAFNSSGTYLYITLSNKGSISQYLFTPENCCILLEETKKYEIPFLGQHESITLLDDSHAIYSSEDSQKIMGIDL